MTDFNHTVGFTAAAGLDDSFERALKIGQGLSKTGWAMLTNDEVANAVKQELDQTVAERRKKISPEEEWAIATSYDKEAFANGGASRSSICACGKL